MTTPVPSHFLKRRHGRVWPVCTQLLTRALPLVAAGLFACSCQPTPATPAAAAATMPIAQGATPAPAATVESSPAAPPPSAPAAKLPANWAEQLAAEPKTPVDGELKNLITASVARLQKLEADSALVRSNRPVIETKLLALLKEYNRDKTRYAGDHFTAAECLKRATADLEWWLSHLEKHEDPAQATAGRWTGPACWIEGTNVLGQYDLVVPKHYDPAKSYPLIFCFQDSPDLDQIRQTDYFLIRGVQKGYPKGWVGLEKKVQAFLQDAALAYNIDPFRVYGTGFSFGGHTCLTYSLRYPHVFAAIVPVCNDLRDETAPDVKYLTAMPTLLLHGDHDSFLETGKKIYGWMQAAGCPVWWDTYAGGHDPGVPFTQRTQMLTQFMDRHVMDPYPRTVTKVIEHKRYTRAFWVDGQLVKDAPNQHAGYTVAVQAENRIVVTADEGIAALELHLNAKLVELAKPVTVMAAGAAAGAEPLFQGPVPADGVITVRLRAGEEYGRENTTPLWERLAAIRAQRGFAHNPVPIAPAAQAVPPAAQP